MGRSVDLIEEGNVSIGSQLLMEKMRKNSAGVFTIRDFMAKWQDLRPHFRLGLDQYRSAWNALRELIPFSNDAYLELAVERSRPNTSTLMEKMTAAAGPDRSIVFFVPRNVFKHPQKFVTAAELEWLFAHPDQMKNVYFVFGAYDILTEQGYALLSAQLHDSRAETDALKSLYVRMQRP